MMLQQLPPLLAVSLLGCTLSSDFDVHQCDTHTECDALSGGVMRCEAHRCVHGCASNQHCASIDPRTPLCQRSSGTCVGLTSGDDQCFAATGYEPARIGPLAVEDLIILGTFAPTLRTPAWLGAQLAVQEFNARDGLPVRGTNKPVITIICNASTRSAQEASVDHLVETLRASAIIASLDDDALRAALERPSTKSAALYLSPNGFDPWHVGGSSAVHAWYLGEHYGSTVNAYAPVLKHIVALLAARGKDADLVRIAGLVGATREDDDMATAVARTIVIEGKDFTRLENEGRYLTIRLDDSQPQAQAVVDYAPDIVLLFAGGMATTTPHRSRAGIIEDLESLSGDDWSPIYILSSRSVREPFVGLFAAASPAFRSRAIGLTAERPPDATASAGLIARYSAAFPVAPPAELRFGAAPQTYDAVYYAALATAAAPGGSGGSGEAIAAGLERITRPDAEPVAIGPEGLGRAAELLVQGVPFNLIASTGEASFDPGSFSRSTAPRIVCWLSDGSVADRGVPGQAPDTPAEFPPLDCAREVLDERQ